MALANPGLRPGLSPARPVQISWWGRRSRIDLLGELILRPEGRKSGWVATLVEFIGVAVVGVRTKPSSLDGCPMFAQAYMGRKRRGAALPTLCYVAKRLRPRARVLAHGVKALEESVFGPCTLGRTWGTRPEPLTVVGRLKSARARRPNLDESEVQPSLRN
jgi:hypothetical protein